MWGICVCERTNAYFNTLKFNVGQKSGYDLLCIDMWKTFYLQKNSLRLFKFTYFVCIESFWVAFINLLLYGLLYIQINFKAR